MKIFVFKTNIALKKDLESVRKALKDCPFIQKWNVDLDDVDKVLRVVTSGTVGEIIRNVNQAGYRCEELPD